MLYKIYLLKVIIMHGIEKLKEACLLVINLAEGFESKLEDGKLTVWEALGIAGKNAKDVLNVIRNAKGIKAEFLDLDDQEKEELIAYIKSELDLENDKLEEIVEKSIEWIDATANLIEAF